MYVIWISGKREPNIRPSLKFLIPIPDYKTKVLPWRANFVKPREENTALATRVFTPFDYHRDEFLRTALVWLTHYSRFAIDRSMTVLRRPKKEDL
jgi:hypothetical protein